MFPKAWWSDDWRWWRFGFIEQHHCQLCGRGGGVKNLAGGQSFVGGGFENLASGYISDAGGAYNEATNTETFVGGGAYNIASAPYSTVSWADITASVLGGGGNLASGNI